jgi:hypothetical protein
VALGPLRATGLMGAFDFRARMVSSRLAHRVLVLELRMIIGAVVIEFGLPGEPQLTLRALMDGHDDSPRPALSPWPRAAPLASTVGRCDAERHAMACIHGLFFGRRPHGRGIARLAGVLLLSRPVDARLGQGEYRQQFEADVRGGDSGDLGVVIGR